MTSKRTVLLLIVLIIAIAGVLGAIRTSSKAIQQITADPGTLDWYAQQAQAQGAQEYDFRAGRLEFSEPDLWDDVLANYSFVNVQLVALKSYPAALNRNIETWYKFRVNETLSQKPILSCDGCSGFPDAPGDMLPLQPNEILVSKSGGVLTYNGVVLTAQDPEFPDFLYSQNYLLILQLDTASQVGVLSLGPWGAYSIDSSGIMHVSNPDLDVYHNDLTNRYANSINQLRAFFSPPPPSSSCDPTGSKERSCNNRGGDWDPTTCTCTGACGTPQKPWLCY